MKDSNKFLEELTTLSNKYKIIVNGCGCCGSPWIEDISGDGSRLYGDGYQIDIKWNEKLRKYIEKEGN